MVFQGLLKHGSVMRLREQIVKTGLHQHCADRLVIAQVTMGQCDEASFPVAIGCSSQQHGQCLLGGAVRQRSEYFRVLGKMLCQRLKVHRQIQHCLRQGVGTFIFQGDSR